MTLLALAVLGALAVYAAPADTGRGQVRADTVWSNALGVSKRLLVYLPPSYDQAPSRRYPVAFYLHGAWGGETDWIEKGRIHHTMDSLVAAGLPEMILVLPDGDDGFYTTWNALNNLTACRADTQRSEPAETYCVPWPKYDEYVARELVAYVDSSYRTLAGREHRAIAGLSMGGYGAITLALRYPDVFAAAASHSGLLSPRYAGPNPYVPPTRYATSIDSIRVRYGAALWGFMEPVFGSDTAGWRARDPIVYARHLLSVGGHRPELFIDVGRDDFLVEQNRAFHADLTRLGYPVRYREWPGRHDWPYWTRHAAESLEWLAALITPARSGT